LHFFYRITRFVLPCILLLSSNLTAQRSTPHRDEEGDPVIEHFDTKALGFDVTNWSCVRDRRGVLWAGNSSGLLEYDGHSWRLLPSTNDTPVYDVACGEDGIVYFGLRGAFGRVVYGADGRPRMDLLSKRLPPSTPLLTEVYSVLTLGSAVYFISEEAVCRWDGKSCTAIASEYPLGRSFISRGRLYVTVDSVGLCVLRKGRFARLPGGELFAPRTMGEQRPNLPDKVIALFHDRQGRLIVGSRMRGLFRHDGRVFRNIVSFSSISDPQWMPTRAEPLANGMLVVGTTHSGIWIFDSTGAVRRILDRETGFNGGSVNNLYIDADQSIWVSLDDGITRVEWPGEPITRFGAERGLLGQVTSLRRYGGTLFAATTQGLYSLRTRPSLTRRGTAGRSEFELVPSIRSTVYTLLDAGDVLLAATAHGIFAVDQKRQLRRISPEGSDARVLHALHGSRDTIIVGSHHGVSVLIRSEHGWETHPITDRPEDFILSIAETRDGNLWIGTVQDGARRLDLREGAMRAHVQDFDTADGLPGSPIIPVPVGGRVLFLSNDGPFAFDAARGAFQPDTVFLQSFTRPMHDVPRFLFEDMTGRVWMQFFEGNTLQYAVPLRRSEKRYHLAPLLRMSGDVISIMAEADGMCWLGTDDAVYRFNPYAPRRGFLLCETLIRRVSVNAIPVFFGGGDGQSYGSFEIDPDPAAIDIDYASGNIAMQDCMLYRWRLEGLDTAWSDLSASSTRRYTDLAPGDYVFHVQAVLSGQNTCDEAHFAFIVLAPWYARWWVWGTAVVLFVLLLITVRVIRRSRIRPR